MWYSVYAYLEEDERNEHFVTAFGKEKEAEDFCEAMDWCYTDENGMEVLREASYEIQGNQD